MIDGLQEMTNLLYFAKLLHEDGYVDLIETFFQEGIELYDHYYEILLSLNESLFEPYGNIYSEKFNCWIEVYSGDEIQRYFILAGQHAKKMNEPFDSYVRSAKEYLMKYFDFSYSLDFLLYGYADPERKEKSRFALLIAEEFYEDMTHITYGFIMMKKWFAQQCDLLSTILCEDVKVA